jgi:hypothetical protein
MVDKNELTLRVKAVSELLEGLEIKTQEAYEKATEFLKKIKDSKSFIESAFEEDRKTTKAAYDAVLEQKRNFVKPMDEADKIVREKMSVYATRIERERREREKEARAKLLKEQEEAALRQAEEQVAMGRAKEADKIIEKASSTTILPMSWGREKKVVKTVTVWQLTVTDMVKFLEYILLSRNDLLPVVMVDNPALVKILKEEAGAPEGLEIPGIKIDLISRPSL